ncbi:FecR family protein [Sphingobacterium pedocola]|uniref:FecR protein domain-containing protein n=1 Tax=Sphingobacterium pedocola TaxID=2082722 RepID=A0ABR9T884_9SPHI|nr:FecR domain-containing protein [Sphingobacterium pedocola]MBE8721551.1 hypothetical protein [Sphingobacterium pedocola]
MINYKELYTRFLNCQCSKEEAKLLLEHFRSEEGDMELVALIESRLAEETDITELAAEDQQIISLIGRRIEKVTQRRYPRLKRWLPYVAAVLLAGITLSGLLWGTYISSYFMNERPIDVASDDILPGGNRATLHLGDGQVIALNEDQNKIILGEDHITYGNGAIPVFGQHEFRSSSFSDTLTLTTPRGGTYQVTLPDGSNIWLNANTTLKYPTRFRQEQRVVFLEGEAFFEVAAQFSRQSMHKYRIPFKVISHGQEVEVLGTKFNISAYKENMHMQTTLTEGKVRIGIHSSRPVSSSPTKNVMLMPGQQAVVYDQAIEVKNVDTEPYIAWKDGFFHFDHVLPKVAISELARWYDLDVTYEGSVPEVRIFGIVSRDKPLHAVLKSLEKSGLAFKLVRSSGRNKLIILGEDRL